MKAAKKASSKNAILISISLHWSSFSAAMRMAYQPAIKAAKPMANFRSALVMLTCNTTAPARSRHFQPKFWQFVPQRCSAFRLW
jgi:hypothetical protein